ncbi:hypothetical protein IL306_010520, partial [Fusarium sp. DS 682]
MLVPKKMLDEMEAEDPDEYELFVDLVENVLEMEKKAAEQLADKKKNESAKTATDDGSKTKKN